MARFSLVGFVEGEYESIIEYIKELADKKEELNFTILQYGRGLDICCWQVKTIDCEGNPAPYVIVRDEDQARALYFGRAICNQGFDVEVQFLDRFFSKDENLKEDS